MTAYAQRLAALSRANEVRRRRADLKSDLEEGRVKLAAVLFSSADWLQSMKVRELLLATPRIGSRKAHRALQASWLSPTVPLGRTSLKSREVLLDWLVEKHPSADVGWQPQIFTIEASK